MDVSLSASQRARSSSLESAFVIDGFAPSGSVHATTRSLSQDIAFLARLSQKCCFSMTTVVGALDILLRLFEKGLSFHSCSWRSVFVTCLLISEKMWEDNFVHPQHIIGQYNSYCPGQFSHSKRDWMYLQLGLVGALNWKTNLTISRYHNLVAAVMATEVPASVYRVLHSQSHAALVPRPLPAIPKMVLAPKAERRSSLASSWSKFSKSVSHSTASTANSTESSGFLSNSQSGFFGSQNYAFGNQLPARNKTRH